MAQLKVKDGVQPRIINIIAALANVTSRLASPTEVVITAGIDGSHKLTSKHYLLAAIDVRTHNFPSDVTKANFMAALKDELGPNYRVLFESVGTPNEHWHIDWIGPGVALGPAV